MAVTSSNRNRILSPLERLLHFQQSPLQCNTYGVGRKSKLLYCGS